MRLWIGDGLYWLTCHKVSELAKRILQAETEVKTLVNGYQDDDDEQNNQRSETRDLEVQEEGMDAGSDDDEDSDDQSIDALEDKWNDLGVGHFRSLCCAYLTRRLHLRNRKW